MKNKKKDIFENMLGIYIEMYKAKNLLNKNYFKYTPEEVQHAFNEVINEKENTIKRNKNPIRSSILSISKEKEVEQFYKNNLRYDHGNEEEKKKCLKKISLDELKYLYSIIYSSSIRKNITKGELVDLVEKYFESINRALSMKP